MKHYRVLLNAVILGIIVIMGCADKIPINEMSMARKEIARALSVKADKYAPKELDIARKKLYESHELIKKEEWDKTKATAQLSYKKAQEAYKKSLPLLAKDTIAMADESIARADIVYAEEHAKNEFNKAKDILNKAKTEYKNKKYYDAYLDALKADQEAKNARNVALGKKDILKDSIDEVKLTLNRAKGYDGSDSVSAKISLAQEHLKKAEDFYNKLELKKGFEAIRIAKMNAEEALQGAARNTAKEKIAAAEVMIERARTSEGSEVAVDEFAAAKESLSNAKEMYARQKYDDAIDFSNESVRLSSIVAATKKPVEVKDADKDKDIAGISGEKAKKDITEDENYYYYKVKYRERLKDCLWRIAGRYYQNPRLWKKIYKANKGRIKDPDLIRPGWILKVPKLKDKK